MLEVEAVNFKIKKPDSATWFQVLLQPPTPQLVALGTLISLFGRALIFPFVKLSDCTQQSAHVNCMQYFEMP